ncbi:DUF1080 domain-containing protein [Roseivirga sp. 4D4]|uniref:3-keto-disaccharide hydrolase n=1 Tax=Roseivirga sp. 4D4 TaxID=1889784 RepID=UPI000AF46CF8|nr:DUF1080 domain-containing protein [Roseivirga sp. 4D4]
MKLRLFTYLILATLMASCGSKSQTESSKEADVKETTKWITLFNGENFDGWEMYGEEPFTEHWSIVDGSIACNAGIGEENVGFFRSIMTTKDFGNFELELEYKIAKGGNSGIFYHVVEKEEWGHDYVSGPEYQVLDDEHSRSESEPYKMVASSYAMYPAAATKKPNPYMQWNKVKIVYNEGHVEHWLNDQKVLEFEEGSEDWLAKKAAGKWANADSYAASKTGRISLQNHGDEVYYRNIRIKEL